LVYGVFLEHFIVRDTCDTFFSYFFYFSECFLYLTPI
jgi:hypothetical protein